MSFNFSGGNITRSETKPYIVYFERQGGSFSGPVETLDFGAVSAGELWEVTCVTTYDLHNTYEVKVRVYSPTDGNVGVDGDVNLPADIEHGFHMRIYLQAGWHLRINFENATNGDSLLAYAWGLKYRV